MSNWCYTSYVIDGKRKEVQSLFCKMNNLERRRRPLVGNDFGNTWLGCLVTKLGGNWHDVYCRGSWSDLDWNGTILRFNTETAWRPMYEVFKLVKSVYPSLEIYFSAEEEGMGIFITNDAEGSYFKDRYRIDYDCQIEYFSSLDGVCSYVSEIVGKGVKTREELGHVIDDWNESVFDDDKAIILNEYTVVPNEYV